MQMPVFSMALEMPFHEASIEYFCFAVRGRRGSVAGGGGTSAASLGALCRPEAASLPSWHPMVRQRLAHHYMVVCDGAKRFQLVCFFFGSLYTHWLQVCKVWLMSRYCYALIRSVSLFGSCFGFVNVLITTLVWVSLFGLRSYWALTVVRHLIK